MKKKISLLTGLIASISSFACPVCEKQQPEILKGVTHGAGPQSDWDYVIVWIMLIIVATTLVFTVKWLIKPGEKSPAHIKRFILKFEHNER